MYTALSLQVDKLFLEFKLVTSKLKVAILPLHKAHPLEVD